MYDPLDMVNLAASIACELFRQEERALTLNNINRINETGGIYALFYRGDAKIYRLFRHINRGAGLLPIYVGKAAESATVNGLQGFRNTPGSNGLKERLKAHRRKINKFSNGVIPLQTSDFTFRFLGLPDAHISMAEAGLITFLNPTWNGEGFGSNAPGAGRPGLRPPNWLNSAHGPNGGGIPQNIQNEIRSKVLEQASNVLRNQDARLESARSAILIAAKT